MAKQEDCGNADVNSASVVRVKVEQEVLGLILQKPALTFNGNLEKTNMNCNKKRSEDDVTCAWLRGAITKSDLFIIEAVYRLSFSTVEMIADMLRLLKQKSPEKIVPVVDVDSVRNRVRELCTYGILAGIKYYNSDTGKIVIVYACLHNGFRLLNKQFGYYVYQDDMLLTLNDMDIFGRVAASYCAIAVALYKKEKFVDVQGYGEDKSFGKEFRPQLHAHVRLMGIDGKYQKIAFESMYHNHDAALCKAEDIAKRHLNRLNVLKKWILKCENMLEEIPKIVLVCEDKKGIARAYNLIHKNVPDIEPYVVYTTELVVRTLRMKNDELIGQAFLRLKSDEQGISSCFDEI